MFKAQVANYFGHGNSPTINANGSLSKNIILLKLGRYRVRIKQKTEVISNKLRPNGFIHTSEIEIEQIKNFATGERIVNDLCQLLSLVSMSQVRPINYEFNNIKKSINVSGQSMSYRPLITIMDGEVVKSFIEQVWPQYRKLKRSRKLFEVIEMMTVAELTIQPLEVQLAQAFIILENLKGTYARSKNIPFIKGYFREISSPPKADPAKEKKLGFERLLKDMLDEVGMSPSLRKVIQLRNEIIHFGLSRKPYESLLKHYDTCQDLIREYLLRILGYQGEYWIYSKACREQGVL